MNRAPMPAGASALSIHLATENQADADGTEIAIGKPIKFLSSGEVTLKAILEFNLPEDELQFRIASKAGDYYDALEAVRQSIRKIVKYREIKTVEDGIKAVNDLADEFHQATEGLWEE